jgi:hypothetical protein
MVSREKLLTIFFLSHKTSGKIDEGKFLNNEMENMFSFFVDRFIVGEEIKGALSRLKALQTSLFNPQHMLMKY